MLEAVFLIKGRIEEKMEKPYGIVYEDMDGVTL